MGFCNLSNDGGLSVKLSDGYSGAAADRNARRDVTHHATAPRDAGAGANHNVIRYSCLSTDHCAVADASTASNPDLGCYHAAKANVHVRSEDVV